MNGQELYEEARAHLGAAAGYYNKNVRVETEDKPVNVRIPIDGSDMMDLRIWREEDVLAAIGPYVDTAPRLLHASADPRYQVQEFVEGEVLNQRAPRGVPLPDHVPPDVVRLLAALIRVPAEKVPAVPSDWPRGEDTVGFGRQLSSLTARVYDRFAESHGQMYADLGVPAAPLQTALDSWPALSARPLVCVHSDIHRKNMIVKDGRTTFLDWELALWGDPVYDLAVHVHKMGYLPDELDRLLRIWGEALPASHTVDWERDLDIYLAHEQIKSVIVDTVRYAQAFADPATAPEPPAELATKLTDKLHNAHRRWGVGGSVDEATVTGVLSRGPATN